MSEGDLCSVGPKSLWLILKIELAQDKEGVELFGIGTIKGIRFVDLGVG